MRRLWLPLLVCTVGGCTSWVARSDPLPGVRPEAFPRTVRLLRDDSTRVTLFQAGLVADSVVGSLADRRRLSVPVEQIVRLEARRLDGRRTAALTLATVFGGVMLWLFWPGPIVD